jgi:hypothetical protein
MASSESFEDVGEVSREFEADGGVDWLHAMVLNTQLLVQGAHPQKLPPCQMQGAHRQTHAAFAAEIGIGESHRKLVVIVAYRRAQQEWTRALEFQQKSRKKSCAVVIQPGLSLWAGTDIAVLIEEPKCVAVLQHANTLVGKAGVGQDVMRIA